MNKSVLLRSAISAFFGHITGIVSLFIFSYVAMRLNCYGFAFAFAVTSLIVGSASCGILAGRLSLGIVGGVVSGCIYSSFVLFMSFISKNPSFDLLTRMAFLLGMVFITFVFASFFRRKKRKSRFSKKQSTIFKKSKHI